MLPQKFSPESPRPSTASPRHPEASPRLPRHPQECPTAYPNVSIARERQNFAVARLRQNFADARVRQNFAVAVWPSGHSAYDDDLHVSAIGPVGRCASVVCLLCLVAILFAFPFHCHDISSKRTLACNELMNRRVSRAPSGPQKCWLRHRFKRCRVVSYC